MTAATLTYDEGLAAEAAETLRRSYALTWPEGSTGAITETIRDLAVALKGYRDLRNGIVPEGFPGMAPGPEGFASALRYAAEGADEIAQELAGLLPAAEGETTP
jgi:hypothetical protein